MDGSRTLSGEPLRALLEDLVATGREVEVVFSPALSEACLHVRVGVAAVSDEALGLEHPVLEGRPAELDAGTHLLVVIGLSGTGSGTFNTSVRGPWTGSRGRFPGPVLAVEPPRSLELSQRRAAFRVGIAEGNAVAIVPSGGGGEGCLGTLADLSDTGCGILLDPAEARWLRPGHPYRVLFRVPDEPSVSLELRARLARQPIQAQAERLRVGFSWVEAAAGRIDPARAVLARFIMREQLANRRRWVR